MIDQIEQCNIFLAEATLQHDNLHGHARLAERTGMRIGGLTEIRRIADMAELYGVQVVPHGWKTGITAACGQHFQAATINAPYVEYLSPHLFDSPLRCDLARFDPPIVDGRMKLPEGPGLGTCLDDQCVAKYAVSFSENV